MSNMVRFRPTLFPVNIATAIWVTYAAQQRATPQVSGEWCRIFTLYTTYHTQTLTMWPKYQISNNQDGGRPHFFLSRLLSNFNDNWYTEANFDGTVVAGQQRGICSGSDEILRNNEKEQYRTVSHGRKWFRFFRSLLVTLNNVSCSVQ